MTDVSQQPSGDEDSELGGAGGMSMGGVVFRRGTGTMVDPARTTATVTGATTPGGPQQPTPATLQPENPPRPNRDLFVLPGILYDVSNVELEWFYTPAGATQWGTPGGSASTPTPPPADPENHISAVLGGTPPAVTWA